MNESEINNTEIQAADWPALKQRYVEGDAPSDGNGKARYMPTLLELARDAGIPYGALVSRAEQEEWESTKQKYWAKTWNTFISGRAQRGGGVNAIRAALAHVCENNIPLIQKAMAELILKASDGNLEAIKFLFPYFIGLPEQSLHITGEVEHSGPVLDLRKLTDEELRESLSLVTRLKRKHAADGEIIDADFSEAPIAEIKKRDGKPLSNFDEGDEE